MKIRRGTEKISVSWSGVLIVTVVILTIFTGAEGVSKQYQNKQSSDYLEKYREEEDAPDAEYC